MATGIGETLSNARRQQGRTLADAAADTRVRQSYLAALEQENFEELGGGVYVKGFLRSYARFLGLDPEPLLDAYRREYEDSREVAAPLSQRPVAPMARERQPGIAVVAAVAGALLLVLATIGLLQPDDADDTDVVAPAPPPVTNDDGDDEDDVEVAEEPDPAPEPPADEGEPGEPAEGNGEDDADGDDAADNAENDQTDENDAPDNDEEADDADAPEEEAEPDADGVEVELQLSGNSWMRVTVDGENVFEGERSGGFNETFEGEEEVLLRIGNAGAVSVVVNGEDHGVLGGSGEVVDVSYSADETA